MKMIANRLCKSYGAKQALNEFSFEFDSGIYGLLGENGAGKSTLMNIISCNLDESSGSIAFDGFEGNVLHQIGYMPQQQALYPDFTARSFMQYMASLKKLKKPKEEIDELLRAVNLQEVSHKKCKSFSGGMRQRLLLAQALLGGPKILLLDEPTAGLDPTERIRIRGLISRFAKDKIVIIATHIVSDIEFIASRVIFMKNGRLLAAKSPAEWLEFMENKVFEINACDDEVEQQRYNFLVSNIYRDKSGVTLRVVTDNAPLNAKAARPNLEDVYLYTQNVYAV